MTGGTRCPTLLGMTQTIELSPEERQLIAEAIRTGNLDLFTNYYMQLPNSGSMWMPDDAIGHYRHLFGYEFLFEAWSKALKRIGSRSTRQAPSMTRQSRTCASSSYPYLTLTFLR